MYYMLYMYNFPVKPYPVPYTRDMEVSVAALIALAQDAGRAIMRIYESDDIGLTSKKDDSPLTRADLAAHTLISQELARLTPHIPVISEESDDHDQERHTADRIWLVDPLDGAKEFIKRNGQFTVNIALIEAGVPVVGVVHAPALGVTYWNDEKGAYRQKDGSVRKPISVRPSPDSLVAVVSGSHPSKEVADWLQAHNITETTAVGSSLKLCYVAEGGADVYPRLAPTMEWDTAAGDAVLRAAGGSTLEYPSLSPLIYNKASLLNPFFIAASSAELVRD